MVWNAPSKVNCVKFAGNCRQSVRANLSLKLSLSNVVILLLLVVTSGVMIVGEHRLNAKLGTAIEAAELAAEKTVKLVVTVKDLKFDVVQVQQWLTDISATRGLDGLNDGFEKAEEARASALQNIATARDLIKAMRANDLLDELKRVEDAVAPYFKQ